MTSSSSSSSDSPITHTSRCSQALNCLVFVAMILMMAAGFFMALIIEVAPTMFARNQTQEWFAEAHAYSIMWVIGFVTLVVLSICRSDVREKFACKY